MKGKTRGRRTALTVGTVVCMGALLSVVFATGFVRGTTTTATASTLKSDATASARAAASQAASASASVAKDASASAASSSADADGSTSGMTMEEWAALYPNEYRSYAEGTNKTDEGTNTYGNDWSHAAYKAKEDLYCEVVPYVLDGTCISCKTTDFNRLYDKYGDDVYTMPVKDMEGGDELTYFDCNVCHADSTSLALEPGLASYKNLAGSHADDIDAKVLVCGQCHNAIGQYGYSLTSDWGAKDADPYRYGTSAEALYRAYSEDGLLKADEATGAQLGAPDYSDLEMFLDSTHYNMGVTCVDCHASTKTADDGTTYTDHNFVSPLANDDTLARCLTCHEGRDGVQDAETMKDFYWNAEKDFAAQMDEAKAAHDKLGEALETATAEGVTGDAIDKAREDYSKAHFYLAFCSSYNHDTDYRIAHNPTGLPELADQAKTLCEEGLGLVA